MLLWLLVVGCLLFPPQLKLLGVLAKYGAALCGVQRHANGARRVRPPPAKGERGAAVYAVGMQVVQGAVSVTRNGCSGMQAERAVSTAAAACRWGACPPPLQGVQRHAVGMLMHPVDPKSPAQIR